VLIFEPHAAPEQQVDQNYLAVAPADVGISVHVSCHSLVLEAEVPTQMINTAPGGGKNPCEGHINDQH
jgi:hypothetical protein